jgi:hypothetical protein
LSHKIKKLGYIKTMNIKEDLARVIDLLEISIENLKQQEPDDCASDKTTFIIDRLLRPALKLLENHQKRLTKIFDLLAGEEENGTT